MKFTFSPFKIELSAFSSLSSPKTQSTEFSPVHVFDGTMSKWAIIGVGQSGTQEVTSSDLSSRISPSGIQVKRISSNHNAVFFVVLCFVVFSIGSKFLSI